MANWNISPAAPSATACTENSRVNCQPRPTVTPGREALVVERHLVLVRLLVAVQDAGGPLEEQLVPAAEADDLLAHVHIAAGLAEGVAEIDATPQPAVVALALQADHVDRLVLAVVVLVIVHRVGRAHQAPVVAAVRRAVGLGLGLVGLGSGHEGQLRSGVRASSRAGAGSRRMEDGGTGVSWRNGRRIISARPGAAGAAACTGAAVALRPTSPTRPGA